MSDMIDEEEKKRQMSKQRGVLRALVRGAYDLQKLRIQTGGRVFANFRSKAGLESSETEETDPEASDLLKKIRHDYVLITEGVAKNRLPTVPNMGGELRELPDRTKFKGTELISDYAELTLVHNFLGLLAREKWMFRQIEPELEKFNVYNTFLKHIKGLGPYMAGCILSELDLTKADYPADFFIYTGTDVVVDPETGIGTGRSKRREHLVERTYKDKKGVEKTKLSITYNEWIKTKLLGVMANNFIKLHSEYTKVYYDYRHRLEHREDWKEKTKLHRHRAALRYMIKMFLIDLHFMWSIAEGIPPTLPYHERVLGKKHHGEFIRDVIIKKAQAALAKDAAD